jgi:hypothetical protein
MAGCPPVITVGTCYELDSDQECLLSSAVCMESTPKDQVEVGAEASPDLPNLLGRVLAEGVRRLIRRGLDRG